MRMVQQLQVAVLFNAVPTVETVCGVVGASVERRQGRHDLPIQPAHSLLCKREGEGTLFDLFEHRWHDSSGEDAGPGSPTFTHSLSHDATISPPGALQRAVQQYRGADDAAIAAANHSAFVLLRPAEHGGADPLGLFASLLDAALLVAQSPGASCIFNPLGEVLALRPHLEQTIGRYREQGLPPIELLCNARFFEVGAGWALADCVGLGQVGLADQEAVFLPERLESEEALHFVRNLAMHFVQHRPEVSQGDTAGGPEESLWEALPLGQGAVAPERPVIRWLPEQREGMPKGLEVP